MTAWGSIDLAVKGMRAGAIEFITKPWTHERVVAAVETVLGISAAKSHTAESLDRAALDARYRFDDLIGTDPRLLEVLDLAGRISQTLAPVLVTGESGTGKELVAKAVHRNSGAMRSTLRQGESGRYLCIAFRE